MRKLSSLIVFLLVFSLHPASAKKQESWSQKMKTLNEELIDLFLILGNGEKRLNPVQEKKVEAIAKKFAIVSHEIDINSPPIPDADPTINYLTSAFHDESKRALQTYQMGQKDYAKQLLRSLTRYCFQCHSRVSNGPHFTPTREQERRLMRLETLDQADFYAATRNYDAAYNRYLEWISDNRNAVTQTFTWERAVKSALVVTIRVMKSPEKSLTILEQASANSDAPFFFRELLQSWKKSVLNWQKEAERTPKTEEGLFAEATRLMAEAKTLQKFPADRSADVIYLRATLNLHELLQAHPKGGHSAEAFYMLGVAYEVLRLGPIWNIPEFFYVSCIQAKPNSEISRLCFQSAEVSIYNGYTGSGGTFIPNEVKQKLRKLDIMSLPDTGKPKGKLQ